jgi:hypothetical protein
MSFRELVTWKHNLLPKRQKLFLYVYDFCRGTYQIILSGFEVFSAAHINLLRIGVTKDAGLDWRIDLRDIHKS